METPNYNLQPKNMRLTPRGVTSAPVSRVFPQVRGGQCEFHGTIDPYQAGDKQYKLCPCYQGMDLKCVYCPASADQDEVVKKSILNVHEHPNRPNELIVRCGMFDCLKAHEKAFGTA